MNSEYVPVEIEELPGGVLLGYSPALNLRLRWESGGLALYDPATNAPIASFDDLQTSLDRERARADAELAARLAAQSRIRELEERMGSQGSWPVRSLHDRAPTDNTDGCEYPFEGNGPLDAPFRALRGSRS